ncbi:MAG: DUF1015 family protein [Nitriliruptoraceae bacterium]
MNARRESFSISPLDLHVVSGDGVDLSDVLLAEESGGAEAGRRAGAAVRALVDAGALRPVGRALAVHELVAGDLRQWGIVAGVSVRDVVQGRVRLHEQTRSDREQALSDFLEAAGLDTAPVVLAHRDLSGLDAQIAAVAGRTADLELTTADGVDHRVWIVNGADIAPFVETLGVLEGLTVLDGHHRVAAAVRRGDPEALLMAELVADHWVNVRSLDRRITLGDLSVPELLARLSDVGVLTEVGDAEVVRPEGAHEILVHAGGRWQRLAFTEVNDDPVGGLPPVLLQARVLGPVLGVDDPRTDPRIEHLPGIVPLSDLARADDDGHATFVPRALTMAEIHAVARSDRVLPPKSTWVEPKPGPGVLVHLRTE